MFRSFQTRLVFFSWILFALVEALTFFLVQNAIRDNIFDQARQQLIDTNEIFNQRVAATADTLAEGATILASDYGFRQAFATVSETLWVAQNSRKPACRTSATRTTVNQPRAGQRHIRPNPRKGMSNTGAQLQSPRNPRRRRALSAAAPR